MLCVTEGLADGIGWRKAREHNAIQPLDCDAAALAKRDCAVEVLEIPHLDRAQDEPEQLAIGTIDPARQKDRPCAVPSIGYWRADVAFQFRIRFQRLKIVAIGDIDFGSRPRAREVDELPVAADHGDGVELRDAADLLAEE